jgi:hypothetical protein
MSNFLKGFLTGAVIVLALVLAVRFFWERDRKIYEYMEAQHELQTMREDYSNRPSAEFLEDPGVRGAVEEARDGYYRRLDEILDLFDNLFY